MAHARLADPHPQEDCWCLDAAGKILKYKMREQAVEMLNLQADNAIETA